jgi:hypothetical protein
MPISVVAVLPWVSTGGALFAAVAVPWQLKQVIEPACTWPSMCCAGLAIVLLPAATVSWHPAQLVAPDGWGAGGGSPWQVPQAAWLPSTLFQMGLVALPPPSVAPWQ